MEAKPQFESSFATTPTISPVACGFLAAYCLADTQGSYLVAQRVVEARI